MSQYSNEELFEMLMLYSLCNRNAHETAREFQRTFPNSRHPSGRFISRLVQRMRERGSIHPVGGPGRPRLHSSDVEIDVLSYFYSHPHSSVRIAASEMNVPRTTVWRILRRNKMHPFSIHGLQGQESTDYQRRLDFCNWALNKEDAKPSFLKNIIWTDECCFKQDGCINPQNEHFWSDTNPLAVHDIHHQKQFSVNVWCGIFRNRLLGPILYDGTLTGDRYLNEILNVVIPDFMNELPLTVLPHVWFQQDGSPAHQTTVVKQWLNNEFPDKWIGLNFHPDHLI